MLFYFRIKRIRPSMGRPRGEERTRIRNMGLWEKGRKRKGTKKRQKRNKGLEVSKRNGYACIPEKERKEGRWRLRKQNIHYVHAGLRLCSSVGIAKQCTREILNLSLKEQDFRRSGISRLGRRRNQPSYTCKTNPLPLYYIYLIK